MNWIQANAVYKSKPQKKEEKVKFINIRNERKREYGIECSLSTGASLNQRIVYCTFIFKN